MKSLCVDPSHRHAFEAFVQARGGEIFQSYPWGEFQASVPSRGKFWALRVEEGEATVGTMLVVRNRLPRGLCWLSVARGPVFAEGVDEETVWEVLWQELRELASETRTVFVRIEPAERCAIDFDSPGWRPAHAHHQPDWTLRLDLVQSDEDLLAQMHPKGRYNLRLAQKKGVTVRVARGSGDVSIFYDILQKTGDRDAFGIHAEAYYQNLVKAAQMGGWGTLLLAEHAGVVVAGLLATFYGKTGLYLYGASDHAHRALMAPYALQWEAIQESRRRGCTSYDFLGISPPDQPDHAWKGVTEFKAKFSRTAAGYPPAQEFVFRPFLYRLLLLLKRFR